MASRWSRSRAREPRRSPPASIALAHPVSSRAHQSARVLFDPLSLVVVPDLLESRPLERASEFAVGVVAIIREWAKLKPDGAVVLPVNVLHLVFESALVRQRDPFTHTGHGGIGALDQSVPSLAARPLVVEPRNRHVKPNPHWDNEVWRPRRTGHGSRASSRLQENPLAGLAHTTYGRPCAAQCCHLFVPQLWSVSSPSGDRRCGTGTDSAQTWAARSRTGLTTLNR